MVVYVHNQFMGSVDLNDRLRLYYPCYITISKGKINNGNPYFCRMTEMMSRCVETWVGNITALCDQYLTKTAGELENNIDALKKLSQGNLYNSG